VDYLDVPSFVVAANIIGFTHFDNFIERLGVVLCKKDFRAFQITINFIGADVVEAKAGFTRFR
jgi:hypothetical protein